MNRVRDRVTRRGRGRDETGQALVEFALVLSVVILMVSVAFNGWNGIQLDLRLTSAARAGALKAANELAGEAVLNNGQPLNTCQANTALGDATAAVNQEEGFTGVPVYQCTDPTGPNYVGISTNQDVISKTAVEPAITINVVTITISGASISIVPVVGNISVSAHAAAEYS